SVWNSRGPSGSVQSAGDGDVTITTVGNEDFALIGGVSNELGTGVGSGLAEVATAVVAPFDFNALGGSVTLNFVAGSGWILNDPGSISTPSRPVADTAPISVLSPGDDIVNFEKNAIFSTSSANSGFSNDFGYFLGSNVRAQLQ